MIANLHQNYLEFEMVFVEALMLRETKSWIRFSSAILRIIELWRKQEIEMLNEIKWRTKAYLDQIKMETKAYL